MRKLGMLGLAAAFAVASLVTIRPAAAQPTPGAALQGLTAQQAAPQRGQGGRPSAPAQSRGQAQSQAQSHGQQHQGDGHKKDR